MIRSLFLILATVSWCAAQDRVLWKDPGDVARIDFTLPAGGARNTPQPPFSFLSESLRGSSPKVLVRDKAGVKWRVKGGLEPNAESFSTRFVAALGYYVEPTAFVPRGKVEGVTSLKRAAGFIQPDGSFSNGSFELRSSKLHRMAQDWAWNRNPFLGRKEFNGLKVVMMLLSNWDNKDARDRWIGSNTGIAQHPVNGRIQLVYRVTDWGQTLGAWGGGMTPKGWNCGSFTAQTKSFFEGRAGDTLRFGFVGLHNDGFQDGIKIGDVRWLLGYLGRITDAQMQDGLKASGANPAETSCFAEQLRERITQLQRAVQEAGAALK
jgi:hypothetical protein